MFSWRKNSREQKQRREEEMTKVVQALQQIQLREPTTGTNARSWKERATERPDGLLATNWKDRWRLIEPNDHDLVAMPEEAVGAVFPGDTVDIDGRNWTVVEIYQHWDWPVALVELAP